MYRVNAQIHLNDRSKERRGHTVAVSCGVSNTISCSLPMSEGGSTEVLFFRWLALTQLTPARWASFRLLCLNIVTTLLCVWVNQLKRWVGRGFGLWSSAYPCVALVPWDSYLKLNEMRVWVMLIWLLLQNELYLVIMPKLWPPGPIKKHGKLKSVEIWLYKCPVIW